MNVFEDTQIGLHREIGSHTFTADDIVAFARRWDPQPFHTDPEAARHSTFGALCASGWHTACVWMRLNVADQSRHVAALVASGREPPRFGPSPGIFALRWPRPVYVDDTVSYSWTVSEKRELASRPDWGLVTYTAGGVNQDGDPVLTFTGRFFLGRRTADA